MNSALRRTVFERDDFRCGYCGYQPTLRQLPSWWKGGGPVELHVDHIYPKALGGTDDLDNLTTACVPCNMEKGTKLWIPGRTTCYGCGEWTTLGDPVEVLRLAAGPAAACEACKATWAEHHRQEVALDLELDEFSDLALEQASWDRAEREYEQAA